MKLILEAEWSPVGIADLENNAFNVVRSTNNKLVVAGPGAGKTELLAQRANYLLTTGLCPHPRKILAISFKRDAAKNLADRVRERSADFPNRFDSMTLDSFAKQLIDRFFLALPTNWQPKPNYLVRTSSIPEQDARMWLGRALLPAGRNRPDLQSFDRNGIAKIMDKVMHGVELPYENTTNETLQAWGKQWWSEQLSKKSADPSLTFPMLNRLAAYLIRSNPKLAKALRMTYSHLFLDEFQDTTASQWDLITAAFSDSSCVLTAVGDSKQRIMSWAGADAEIFSKFKSTFNADEIPLIRNYRSVPALVRIQHAIAQVIEVGSNEPEAASTHQGEGVCSILGFKTPELEALFLAKLISDDIENGANARDFCIIVRQNASAMIALLQAELKARGVSLRDESLLQDLKAEPVTNIVILTLRLATSIRDAKAWNDLTTELGMLAGLNEETHSAELEKLVLLHKGLVETFINQKKNIEDLPTAILELVGTGQYRSCYRQYMNGSFLEKIAAELGEALKISLVNAGSIEGLVADFTGENVVPAMTIHKSKGLEFKTVIFIGLEDEQWWNFRNQPDEEKRAFFVAFSRAIHSVLFTFSHERPKWGRPSQTNRQHVGALIDVLNNAGVELIDVSA